MTSSQTRENTRNHFENFQFGHFAINEYRPIKIVCIGAGFCGILAAIHFARKVPNIELTVYRKEKGIGSTCVRHFPGRHSLSSRISPFTGPDCTPLGPRSSVTSTEWSKSTQAQAPHKTATRAHVRLVGWEDTSGSGVMETVMRRSRTRGTCFSWVLASSIPGLSDFRGRVLLSAQWGVTEEGWWEEVVKDAGIRPLGPSGIQLVTELRPKVKSIVNYILSKTWIGEPCSLRTMLELAGRDPGRDDYKDCEAFRDEKYYKEFRHKIEADLNIRLKVIIPKYPFHVYWFHHVVTCADTRRRKPVKSSATNEETVMQAKNGQSTKNIIDHANMKKVMARNSQVNLRHSRRTEYQPYDVPMCLSARQHRLSKVERPGCKIEKLNDPERHWIDKDEKR
ncbi:hypothetical protein B0F90DRAFT_1672218 [Multifurca ochricompacta]|uniref:Uncharacterized protein n=1 Tax=Multifurca ochricompacta TaxID=376703 RepID=A0AAD4QIU2_9AGAM|nr:hypothetical protein B0F90DRAFT_1672218 [Multifurca ochricompacta]